MSDRHCSRDVQSKHVVTFPFPPVNRRVPDYPERQAFARKLLAKLAADETPGTELARTAETLRRCIEAGVGLLAMRVAARATFEDDDQIIPRLVSMTLQCASDEAEEAVRLICAMHGRTPVKYLSLALRRVYDHARWEVCRAALELKRAGVWPAFWWPENAQQVMQALAWDGGIPPSGHVENMLEDVAVTPAREGTSSYTLDPKTGHEVPLAGEAEEPDTDLGRDGADPEPEANPAGADIKATADPSSQILESIRDHADDVDDDVLRLLLQVFDFCLAEHLCDPELIGTAADTIDVPESELEDWCRRHSAEQVTTNLAFAFISDHRPGIEADHEAWFLEDLEYRRQTTRRLAAAGLYGFIEKVRSGIPNAQAWLETRRPVDPATRGSQGTPAATTAEGMPEPAESASAQRAPRAPGSEASE